MARGNNSNHVIKIFRQTSAKNLVIVGICFSLVVLGCGQDAGTQSLCQLSTRWNLASSAMAQTLAELESQPANQIREAMTETVETLVALNEVAPREIKSDVEMLLNTYGALSDALESLNWQGSLSRRDSAVESAAVRMASDEIQQAQANLSNFVGEKCSVTIENAINQFPNVGTTLPDPIIADEKSPEPLSEEDSEEKIARAFGFVAVERFGVAITDEQAICVGDALIAATSMNPNIVDSTYWTLLQTIFDSCDIRINIAEALESE